jgi:general secretion pathway protein G
MVNRQGSGIRDQSSVRGRRLAGPRESASTPAEPCALSPDFRTSGFTLIELMIVMAIIAILAMIAVPSYTANVKHAREAVLKEDLHTLRSAIDSYTYDKQKAPQSLDDLVQSGYLHELPKDPFTQRSDTWLPSEGSMLTSLDETQGGIDDVHSGSQQVSTEGTTYNTW